MSKYAGLSREELIEKLEKLEAEKNRNSESWLCNDEVMASKIVNLRKTIADILIVLLHSEATEAIDKALVAVMEFFEVDRAYINLYDWETGEMSLAYEVTHDRLFTIIDELNKFTVEDFPWWCEATSKGKDIIIPSVENMPPEAWKEKNILQLQDILSLISIPLFLDGKVIASLGLDAVRAPRKWSLWERENLRLLGDIILVAMERRRALVQIEESQKLLQKSEANYRLKAEQSEELLAKLKLVVGFGDSLMWEYDTATDNIHIELELVGDDNPEQISPLHFCNLKNKQDFFDIIYPDDRKDVIEDHFEPLLQGKINHYTIQYRRLSAKGYIWVEASVRSYKWNEDGTPAKVLYYLTNIDMRKQLQSRLAKEENKNRKIVQAIPDFICVIDRNKTVLDILSYLEENLVCPIEQQIGRNITELLPLSVCEEISETIDLTFTDLQEHDSYYRLNVIGGERYFHLRVIPYEEGTVMLMSRNITDSINAEEALRMFSYAVQQSQDEIYALDRKGRFVFANERVTSNYNFTGLLNSYSLTDINPTMDVTHWDEMEEAVRNGNLTVYEALHTLPDGTSFPAEVYIYRVEDIRYGELFWCFARNITERIRQRNQIGALNRLMNMILNNVPVVIIVKDIQSFQYVYFNTAAENFTGLKSENVIGKNDYEVYEDLEFAQSVRDLDLLAVESGEYSCYAADCKTTRGDIRIINSVRLVIDDLSDKEGKTSLLITLIWDITKERQNEIDLIKAQEADKLKSAFLANMSHEIRTPLNAIVGFSSILAEMEDKTERQQFLAIIHKNNELLLQLINDILDFSKIESGKLDYSFEEAELKDICKEMYQVHSLKLKPGVQMIFDEHTLPSVGLYTDVRRVSQIISNFLTNAVKFTSHGYITLSYRVEGKFVRIEVADTGIGIAEENLPDIFQRFVKLNEFKQGTGLGLAICKMLVEKLGGNIGVESQFGVGSTFWFTLPLKTDSLKNNKENRPEKEVADNKELQDKKNILPDRKTILIAEDVEENYLLIKVLLGKQYCLLHAWNGEEAVELYKKYHPSLLLMDLKMPVKDGFEATREIKTLSPEVPVIALSAFAFEAEKEKARVYGFDDYLVKPVDIELLKRTVMNYINRN